MAAIAVMRRLPLGRGVGMAATVAGAGFAALGMPEPAIAVAAMGLSAVAVSGFEMNHAARQPAIDLVRNLSTRAASAEGLNGALAAVLEQIVRASGAESAAAIIRRGDGGLCDAHSWADRRIVVEELLWQADLADPSDDGSTRKAPRLPPRLGTARHWIARPLVARGEVCGAIVLVEPASHARPWLESALTVLASQLGALVMGERYSERLERGYLATIETLIGALEAKDPYTAGHSGRVAQYALAIARELGLADELLPELQTGATLHDIGKIGVGDGVLLKAGRLSDDEFDQIKDHPRRGARIIDSFNRSQTVLAIVFHHHERYDGRGYPAGLRGVDIPLAARIVNVADAFDAMTTNRPYNSTRSRVDALAELRRGAGSQFDPRVVEALEHALERGAA